MSKWLRGTWSRVGPPRPRPELPANLPPDWTEFTDPAGVTWFRLGPPTA